MGFTKAICENANINNNVKCMEIEKIQMFFFGSNYTQIGHLWNV